MQISLSKLSSIVDICVARTNCLYIIYVDFVGTVLQYGVSEYTHMCGCSMNPDLNVFHVYCIPLVLSFNVVFISSQGKGEFCFPIVTKITLWALQSTFIGHISSSLSSRVIESR